MNASTKNEGLDDDAALRLRLPRPKTLEELLHREERLAIDGITADVDAIGAELSHALDLPEIVRDHPLRSLGISALTGAIVAAVARAHRSQPGARPRRHEPKEKKSNGLLPLLVRTALMLGAAPRVSSAAKLFAPQSRWW